MKMTATLDNKINEGKKINRVIRPHRHLLGNGTVWGQKREKKITEKPLTTKYKKRNHVKKDEISLSQRFPNGPPIQVPTLSDRPYL